MIAARQIFLGRGGGAKLPYDAEVEYLESTGTQWIDTGIALSNASLADITWVVEVTNFNDGCMGVFGQTPITSMYVNFYSSKFYLRNMRTNGGNFAGVSGFNTIRFAGGNSYLNGTAVETDIPLKTDPTNSMFLFAYNRSNAAQNLCKARVSSFTVKVGDVLIADFMPVRFTNELGQSEGAMYDRVSGQLFRNQGTDAFLYGGDVYSVPVETSQYVQDGLVAMWDGKENAGVGKRCDTAQSWVDLSGNGHNATRNGTADFGTNCATLDGTTYFVTQNEMDLSAGFTIEVCARQTSSNNDRDYVSWNIGSGEKLGVDVYNARGASLLRCKFGKGDSVGFFGWSYSSTPGILDEACTIVYTDTALSDMAFWLNASKKQWYNYNVALTSPSDKRIVIGANLSNANKIPGSIMYGEIYSIRIYNKILTDAEIAANYAVDKQRFNLP